MRLGIFGGTFNPIHLGHLIAAERLCEELGFARVLFIPSFLPPHKDPPEAAPGHRLEMVRRAMAGNPRFEASDLEIARGGRSYAVDTLRELALRHPEAERFFITGEDAFAEIGSWREAAALFDLCSFAVISRPGVLTGDLRSSLPAGVAPAGPKVLHPGPLARYPLGGGRDIWAVRVPLVEISSSDIRWRVAAGRSIRYLVPAAVEEYITREGLYGRARAGGGGNPPANESANKEAE